MSDILTGTPPDLTYAHDLAARPRNTVGECLGV